MSEAHITIEEKTKSKEGNDQLVLSQSTKGYTTLHTQDPHPPTLNH